MGQVYASLVLVQKDGYILAIKRSDTDNYGLPGGKIEPGEEDLHAAVRECFEETGHVVVAYGPTAYAGLDNEGNVVKTFRADIVTVGEPSSEDEGYPIWVEPEVLIKESNWNEYNLAVLKHFGVVRED